MSELDDLVDRAAIHDVLLRYARGVDRGDLDMVAGCFVPGASYEGALGRGTIEGALASLRGAMARYAGTMHFIGNHVIELDGDGARSEAYALAYHRLRDDPGRLFVVAVRYEDHFVRRVKRWLIARRTVVTEWSRYDMVTPSSSGPERD